MTKFHICLAFKLVLLITCGWSTTFSQVECTDLYPRIRESRFPLGLTFVNGSESRPTRIGVRQESGAYVAADFLGDGVMHVATSAVSSYPSLEKPIFHSPMIKPYVHRSANKFSQVTLQVDGKFVTPEFGLAIQQESLALEILDHSGNPVVKVRPINSKEAWKNLEIETDATQIYGLGEYPRGARADEPWHGWVARSEGVHGNIMSPFFGGVQTYTQFPVAYGVRANSMAFAIFVDTPYKIEWDFRTSGKWRVSTWGDELRYFVLTGKNLADVHQKYMSLIGKPPVPPRGIFGNGISKFGYRSWSEVDKDLEEMHRHGLPVGIVGLDLYWFGGEFIDHPHGGGRQYTKMGSLTPDPTNFPNFFKKVADLKRNGTEVMLVSESYVNANLPEARQLLDWGCIVTYADGTPVVFENKWWGTGYMIDWTHPNAKEWIKLKYLPLAKKGVRYFWFDLGEPENGLYSPIGHYYGIEPGKYNHGDIHNIYNLIWVKNFYEVMEAEIPRERFYIMNRSGTSGLNRFGAGKWGGDTGISVIFGQHEAFLPGDIPELIAHLQNRIKNMPLVGVDYYTSDVGGFHRGALRGNSEHRDKGYTLWYANSALLDIPFRPHLWVKDGESGYLPTAVGDVSSNVANARLRAELEPYYYQAAHRASVSGTPVVAPLFYYHSADPVVREMGHEAYIGRDLLMGVVANIYETNRDVYLPLGSWYDFHTNQFYPAVTGKGQWVSGLPLRRDDHLTLPLFVREGAIIPLNRITSNGLRVESAVELRVRVFVGRRTTESIFLEDDGSTRAYRHGETRRTRIQQEQTANGFAVTIFPSSGHYVGVSSKRAHLVEIVIPEGRVTAVTRNGEKVTTVSSMEELTASDTRVYVDHDRNICVVYSPTQPVTSKVRYSFEVN